MVKDFSKIRGPIFSVNYGSKCHTLSTPTLSQPAASGDMATFASFTYILHQQSKTLDSYTAVEIQ